MFDRLLQASLLTFLLSLILQLGSSTSPPLESNHSTHPFPSQVTKPFTQAINQVMLGWVSQGKGLEKIQRLQKKLNFLGLSVFVGKDSHSLED